MKRFIALLLSFIMLFQLTACGGGGTESNSEATPNSSTQPTVLGEQEVPVTEQENGDIIPETDDFYESQQTVFVELNEKSIGANP